MSFCAALDQYPFPYQHAPILVYTQYCQSLIISGCKSSKHCSGSKTSVTFRVCSVVLRIRYAHFQQPPLQCNRKLHEDSFRTHDNPIAHPLLRERQVSGCRYTTVVLHACKDKSTTYCTLWKRPPKSLQAKRKSWLLSSILCCFSGSILGQSGSILLSKERCVRTCFMFKYVVLP